MIYKILQPAEWQALLEHGETAGAPIDVADGFVHFSTAAQARETAAKHFADAGDLVLAALDADLLGPDLKWEVSRGDALFPHLYGPLRLADICWHAPLRCGPDGHIFPQSMDAPRQPDAHIDPTRTQFDAFKALDRSGPIEMLNLVRLRDKAAYPTGHPLADSPGTGAEAYARYGATAEPVLQRLGGSILWRGGFQTTLIGPIDEAWDHIFVARYPSAHAFLAMLKDADYAEAVIHRQAAVATSRLIRCTPAETGTAFG